MLGKRVSGAGPRSPDGLHSRMEKSIMKKIICTEPGGRGGNGKVYDDWLDVRGANGSSRFVNHSQAFMENEVI